MSNQSNPVAAPSSQTTVINTNNNNTSTHISNQSNNNSSSVSINQSPQVKILTPSSGIKINQINHQSAFTSSPASSSGGGSQILSAIVSIPATILQSTAPSTPPATTATVLTTTTSSSSIPIQVSSNAVVDVPGSTAASGTYGGFAYCSNCGEYGVKAAFYGKAKLYCSVACQNGIKKQSQQQQGVKRPLDSINVPQSNASGITIIPISVSGPTTGGATETSNSGGDTVEVKPAYSPSGESQPPAAKRPRKQSTSTAPVSSTNLIQSPTDPSKKSAMNGSSTTVSQNPNGHTNGKKIQSPAPFHWGDYIDSNGAEAAPVQYFKHAPLRNPWRHIIWQNMLVEVPSSNLPADIIKQEDCTKKQAYWFATVISMAGYMLKVRYLGHSATTESCKEFWIHACDKNVHRVGWSAQHKQLLVPPSDIASKRDADSWINYIIETFEGVKALPRYFKKWVKESIECRFKKNMRLEVLDKSQVSSMRVCRVVENVGGRIRVQYEGDDDLGDFWCHEASDLIHPIGWSSVVGHNISASDEYKRLSKLKYLHLKFAPDECPLSMFKQYPPLYDPRSEFRVGMKLEAIDPCNPGVICPATVARVLKKNYLMIKIDGVSQNEAGLDMFCYHRNSTSIFPINFCQRHNIQLNPPYNYTDKFSWDKYLRETGAEFAPPDLFLNSADVHNPFRVGMKLESVDLMEPGMVCVASVKHVAGRLLKLTFDGWDQNYDQWVDFESCDLFPVGWCELVGYHLQEPPLKDLNASTGSKKSSVKSFKK